MDITDRKLAEEKRRDLEAQLRRSQRLEAIGQLAGGVAHDFNNILTAIVGHYELSIDDLRREVGPMHYAVQALEEINVATQRAATLTRQLLTFSRRDVVQPQVLDLNQILAQLDGMLRRLVSKNIMLGTVTEPQLKTVRVDAGQIEQVVVNLVVNAVHAMPDGGRLTLETQNVLLDEDYLDAHAEARVGPHVLLTVSDTGRGMDAATLDRIFEPFFTTKTLDMGTGLGLSTVHGIVQQAGGYVVAYSELGRGTTFRVYLPAAEGAAPVPTTSVAEAPRAGGGGDSAAVRGRSCRARADRSRAGGGRLHGARGLRRAGGAEGRRRARRNDRSAGHGRDHHRHEWSPAVERAARAAPRPADAVHLRIHVERDRPPRRAGRRRRVLTEALQPPPAARTRARGARQGSGGRRPITRRLRGGVGFCRCGL